MKTTATDKIWEAVILNILGHISGSYELLSCYGLNCQSTVAYLYLELL